MDVLVSNDGLSRVRPLEDITAPAGAGRLGRPSEVADLAAILANAYLTSQVISLDGGIHPR